ncbi:hypothetical protein EPUL_006609, partial [Erysiphe pulchra]
MNCPSRTDDFDNDEYNQNPPPLTADLTVREDFNGRINSRKISRFLSLEEKRENKGYQTFEE